MKQSDIHINMLKHARRYGFPEVIRYHEWFADRWLEAEKDGRAEDPEFEPEKVPQA